MSDRAELSAIINPLKEGREAAIANFIERFERGLFDNTNEEIVLIVGKDHKWNECIRTFYLGFENWTDLDPITQQACIQGINENRAAFQILANQRMSKRSRSIPLQSTYISKANEVPHSVIDRITEQVRSRLAELIDNEKAQTVDHDAICLKPVFLLPYSTLRRFVLESLRLNGYAVQKENKSYTTIAEVGKSLIDMIQNRLVSMNCIRPYAEVEKMSGRSVVLFVTGKNAEEIKLHIEKVQTAFLLVRRRLSQVLIEFVRKNPNIHFGESRLQKAIQRQFPISSEIFYLILDHYRKNQILLKAKDKEYRFDSDAIEKLEKDSGEKRFNYCDGNAW